MTTRASPTGPLSREQFQALVDAPYGKAGAEIRKHDPSWGLGHVEPGEKIKWRVVMEREVTERGYLIVDAVSEDEAMDIAAKTDGWEVSSTGDYDEWDNDWDVVSARREK